MATKCADERAAIRAARKQDAASRATKEVADALRRDDAGALAIPIGHNPTPADAAA